MPCPLTFLSWGGSTELLPRHRSATSFLRFSILRLTRQLSKAHSRDILALNAVLEAYTSIEIPCYGTFSTCYELFGNRRRVT